MKLITDIHSLLKEWGNWSSDSTGLSLNTPRSATYADIDDHTALLVDAAVGELGVTHPRAKKVLELYYRQQRSYRQIGNTIGTGETKARQLHLTSIAWLEGNLLGKGLLLKRAA